MEVKIIRTNDQRAFEKMLKAMYTDNIVERVDTSTEVINQYIYFIAIVFYRNRVKDVNIREGVDANTSLSNVKLPARFEKALRYYNKGLEHTEYESDMIATVGQLVQAIKSGDIQYIRNIGDHTIEEVKQALCDSGYIE